jgi:hypothetical protein
MNPKSTKYLQQSIAMEPATRRKKHFETADEVLRLPTHNGQCLPLQKETSKIITDLEGFEPPTSGLEARRYILAKPQIQHILLYQVVFRDNKMNGIDIILHDNMTGGVLLQR